ncbi:MAG: ribosome biogenesis GTPase Der [Chloroflexota bacterium]|nr:ribosome biogenesis GTPase Der [Chloroflexota bacterium]
MVMESNLESDMGEVEERPLPIVAVVGRPNVGKSSLFNRILARRHAIVSDVAGTTRDRLMSEVEWEGHRFILVDTGGLESDPEGHIREMVQEQADMAMSGAEVIVFVTDGADGMTPTDLEIADRLRRAQRPVILAVNKIDNDGREVMASEFYQMGIAETVMISAYHNYGIYDLMDRVLYHLPPPEYVPPQEEEDEWDEEFDEEDDIDVNPPIPASAQEMRLAIIGRTNVGKSMLLNAILGQERSIVSSVAGTTRDALDTEMTYRDRSVTLIDTAGIRRPGQVQPGIERYSVLRSVNAVSRADITLLITDASELATAQDAHISGLAWDLCKGIIVVVNKWDLVPDTNRYAREEAIARIQDRFHFMPYVPVCFTSALNRQGITTLMNTAIDLWEERMRWIPGRDLQYLLADALSEHHPPPVKGKGIRRGEFLRITRVNQVGVNPPTFLFSCNNPRLVHFTYQRYLENRIRDKFRFDRTHLKLVFRRR